MNIAPSSTSAPSSPSAPRRVDPTAAAAAGGADGVDPPASLGSPAMAFGKLLSKSISDGDAAQAPGADGAGKAHVDVVAEAADAIREALAAGGTSVATTGTLVAKATDPAAATAANPTSKDDDTTADDANPIGSDLAAQLALVSQWAGLGPQPLAAGAAVAPGTLDIKGKLDTIRAAARPTADGTSPAADAAPVPAAAAPTIDPGLVQTAASPAVALAAATIDRTGIPANGRPTTIGTRIAAALPGLSTAAAAALRSGEAKPTEVANPLSSTTPAADASIATGAGLTPVAATEASLAGVLLAHAGVSGATQTTATQTAAQAVAQIASQIAAQTSAVLAGPSIPTAVAVPGDTLREAVGTPAWSHEVGQATLRMAANDLQNVSLRLNPEHLGPMDVQMRVDNGVAHLQFTAAHVDTRQALEASRTTLNQMFNDQGIKLGDWSVGQQSANASFARDFGSARSQSGPRDGTSTDDVDAQGSAITTTIRTTRQLGLVDTFA